MFEMKCSGTLGYLTLLISNHGGLIRGFHSLSHIHYMTVAKYIQVNAHYRKHEDKQWNPIIYIMTNSKTF
jgi:hypothetical protein